MTNKFTKKILDNSDKYIIFYSDWCGYSINAIKLLQNNNLKFKGYKIDKIDGDINFLIQKLLEEPQLNFDKNHKTRPIIFYKGKFLGGYSELQNFVSKK